MIIFENLWKTMAQKGITEMELQTCGVTDERLDALRANDSRKISTRLVDLLCTVLDCPVGDVMENDDGV